MTGLVLLLLVALLLLLVLVAGLMAYTLNHPPRRSYAMHIARDLPTDPAEAGRAYQSEMVRLRDGSELELWVVEGDRPDGPAVVMVHGWGDSRLGALAWLETVCPAAARVVLFDQRAHGESVCDRFQWGAAEVDDVLAVVEHLHLADPKSPVILFGWAMGAALSLEAARQAGGERVAGVIADSPAQSAADAMRQYLLTHRLPEMPLLPLGIAATRLWCPALATLDTTRIAGRLRQPLLVLHGLEDRVVPVKHASAIAHAAALATLEVFPHAGHLEAHLRDTARYAAAVARFLHHTRD